MEEILASIRKIIADDQMLPLTRSAAAAPAVRPVMRGTEPAYPEIEAPIVPPPVLETEEKPAVVAPAPEAAKAPPSLHSMSDFEAAFAELRPSFSVPPMPKAEVADVQPVVPEAPVAAAPAPTPAPAPAPAVAPASTRAATADETALVSPSTGASVSSAFNALATTMFLQNTGMVEEAMRDVLRPMLKQWLDDNLPTLVERLVRAEIERVARGGR